MRPSRLTRFFPPLNSVRGRVVVLAAAVIMPGLLATGLLAWRAYHHEQTILAGKLLNTARAISTIVDGEVEECTMLLRAVDASSALAHDDLDAVDGLARQALEGDDRWFVLTDANTHQERVNTLAPRGTLLPQMTGAEPGFDDAMTQGRLFVSNLAFGAMAHDLVVHVALPVTRDGRLRYTMHVVMRPAAMARALRIKGYSEGAIIAVADRNRRIVARSDNAERYVGHSISATAVEATRTQAQGVVDTQTLEGRTVLTAFTRTGAGWWILVGAPKAEMYADARRLLWLGLACSALLTLVAIFVATWISRAVLQSMDALARDAAILREGRMPPERPLPLIEPADVAEAMRRTAETLLRRTRTLEVLNRVSATLVAERNLEKIVQCATDAARETSGAEFSAFFHNVENEKGESYLLYTLSGAPGGAFDGMGMPRNTPLFAATFTGAGVIRSDDITADPRYGRMGPPHDGIPRGHPPVRSYLAVPVRSASGPVLGGLFLGHRQPGMFTAEAESVVVGLAAEAGVAIENAKLYEAVAHELAAKTEAEARLRAGQQNLERVVEQRTASLREAIAQMEEFSYTVSHDLRAPLRAISGFATALAEDNAAQLDETGRGYVQRILRAADRLDRMTSDLLNYSRIAAAHAERQPVELDKVVRTTVELYPQLHAPDTEIHIASPLPRVLGHEPSLAQAHANLLTNAVKFVRPGTKPRVTVRAEPRGARVRIWIEDNGIGIAPDQQAQLFNVFQRAPAHAAYEGTGIGLAIVRKAVEKMGGACGVVSDGKSGSRFWIELDAA